jgi:hypothetical protein
LDFEENEEYYVSIASSAINNFAGIDNSGGNNWRFTTELPPAPLVTTYNPIQDATDVGISQSLVLSFDQDIKFGVGPQTIRIWKSSDDSLFESFSVDEGGSDSDLSISGSDLTIVHTAFAYNTHYYVTISNGAIESLAGADFIGFVGATDWRFTSELQPPSVSSLNPLNTDTDVAIDQVLSITFNQDIQFSSTLNVIRVRKVSDNVTFNSYTVEGNLTDDRLSITGSTLSIEHDNFIAGEAYYVEIGAGAIESLMGAPFDGFTGSGTWSFTTIIPAPVLTLYNPLQDAIDIGISQSLELTFDQDIQFGAGPQVIRIRRNSDNVVFQSYDVNAGSTNEDLSIVGSVLTINHLPFDYNTQYYVTISNGAIESLASIPFAGFAANTDWRFTTVLQPVGVVSFDPVDGAIDVLVDQTLSITFDQNIQFGTELN